MFLIYYCCLVDYAIRLTCKCIVFFGKKGLIRHIFRPLSYLQLKNTAY